MDFALLVSLPRGLVTCCLYGSAEGSRVLPHVGASRMDVRCQEAYSVPECLPRPAVRLPGSGSSFRMGFGPVEILVGNPDLVGNPARSLVGGDPCSERYELVVGWSVAAACWMGAGWPSMCSGPAGGSVWGVWGWWFGSGEPGLVGLELGVERFGLEIGLGVDPGELNCEVVRGIVAVRAVGWALSLGEQLSWGRVARTDSGRGVGETRRAAGGPGGRRLPYC